MDDQAIGIDKGQVPDGCPGDCIQPCGGAIRQAGDEAAAKIAKRGSLRDKDVIGRDGILADLKAGGTWIEDRIQGGRLADDEVITRLDS